MATLKHDNPQPDGLRERKRRETSRRIAETGLKLFLSRGYAETTLEDISAAAEISRRTFFSYFKSKDEILLAWQGGLAEAVRAAVLAEGAGASPLDALCGALLKLSDQYDSKAAITIARLLRENEQLRAANQVKYLQMEQAAFEALCELYPENRRRDRLRLVAAAGLSAFRVAVDAWVDEGGERSFTARMKNTFSGLRAEMRLP